MTKQRKQYFTGQPLDPSIEFNARGKGTRFKNFNEPPESRFKQLFESILFFLNKEDRAKTNSAGHAIISSDANAKSGTDTGGDVLNDNEHTSFVVPHQLPTSENRNADVLEDCEFVQLL